MTPAKSFHTKRKDAGTNCMTRFFGHQQRSTPVRQLEKSAVVPSRKLEFQLSEM
jgi:hypothetical protein